MASLTTLRTTTKMMTVGLAALVLSACAHYHDGHRYRGGGYYYGDHHKKYDRDRYDGYYDRSHRKKDRSYKYDSYYDRPYDGRYGHRRSNRHYDGYDRGGYYGGYRVCDSDGDRCYSSGSPYWDYRQYYRNHGYRWEDE